MKDSTKQVIALALTGLAGIGLGGAAVALSIEPEVVKGDPVIVEKEVPVETIVFQNVEVPVEVPVEVEVPVDNGNLALVLQHIYDREGDVEYVTSELDEDEVDSIVDAIVFVNDAITLGADSIEAELADDLDKDVVEGVTIDEDDVERVKVDSDLDEVTIEQFDFEDKDLRVRYTGEFEHDDDEFTFEAVVKFKDGEFDEVDFENVDKI